MIKEVKGVTRTLMLEWTHCMVLLFGITGGMALWQIADVMRTADLSSRLILIGLIFLVIRFMWIVFDFVIEATNEWEKRKGKKAREKLFCSGE